MISSISLNNREDSGRCTLRLARTINTNRAASGREEFLLWCQKASGARRGWVMIDHSASPHRLCAFCFQGRLDKVFTEIAPCTQYPRRLTSGVRLSERPQARRIPWSRVVFKLRYSFPLVFTLSKHSSGKGILICLDSQLRFVNLAPAQKQ